MQWIWSCNWEIIKDRKEMEGTYKDKNKKAGH